MRNKSLHSKHLTFKVSAKEGDISSSFGVVIIISKKIIKLATGRNKVKRQLRELFQLYTTKKENMIFGVIYTRKGVQQLTYQELKDETIILFDKVYQVR